MRPISRRCRTAARPTSRAGWCMWPRRSRACARSRSSASSRPPPTTSSDSSAMLISDSKFAPALRALAAGTAALLLLFAGPARAASLDDALIAARMGDTKEIVKLVERGLDVDTVDPNGNSLLILAAREGKGATVRALIERGARLDYRNRAGDSALMLAVLKDEREVAGLLIDAGASLNHEGWAPLHYAAFEGRVELLDRLLA